MNTLEALLNEIQFKTNKNLEEIANDIGYSRPYLTTIKNKGPNKRLELLCTSATVSKTVMSTSSINSAKSF